METAAVLGYIAGTCTTIAFLPQVIKAYRTKSCHDLSAGMLVIFAAGIFFWLIYGVLIDEMPIILANGITLVFVIAIALMKAVYERRECRKDTTPSE